MFRSLILLCLVNVGVVTAQTVSDATVVTYAVTLSVLDSNDVSVTTLAIGDSARLSLSMNTDPFRLGLDYAGARVHTCSMASDSGFTTNVHKLIDANGCSVQNALFHNMYSTSGFERNILTSNDIPSSPKRYGAITGKFEIGAYTQADTSVTNTIFFKCCLTPCLDDTTDQSSEGQCGASHCLQRRRKRDASNDTETVVTASVTLLPKNINTELNQPEEDLCTCPEYMVLFGSMGGLGIVAAIMFAMAVVSYVDFWRTVSRLREGRMVSKSSAMAPQPAANGGGKDF